MTYTYVYCIVYLASCVLRYVDYILFYRITYCRLHKSKKQYVAVCSSAISPLEASEGSIHNITMICMSVGDDKVVDPQTGSPSFRLTKDRMSLLKYIQ